MSCLKVNVTHRDEPIRACVERIEDKITALIKAVETNFKVIVDRTGEQLKVITERIHDPLSVNVSVVCNLSDFYYMEVSPAEIQWITDDMGVFFDVESNVNWIVTTN